MVWVARFANRPLRPARASATALRRWRRRSSVDYTPAAAGIAVRGNAAAGHLIRSPGAVMLVALFGITVVGGMSGERVSGETT